MRLPTCLVLVTSALLLGACQSATQQAELPPRPQGVEGQWRSIGGPVQYTASFQGGQFRSVESATSATLATGTYAPVGPGQVTLTFTSQTTQQRVAANCNQVETNRLSCATSSGSRFELARA